MASRSKSLPAEASKQGPNGSSKTNSAVGASVPPNTGAGSTVWSSVVSVARGLNDCYDAVCFAMSAGDWHPESVEETAVPFLGRDDSWGNHDIMHTWMVSVAGLQDSSWVPDLTEFGVEPNPGPVETNARCDRCRAGFQSGFTHHVLVHACGHMVCEVCAMLSLSDLWTCSVCGDVGSYTTANFTLTESPWMELLFLDGGSPQRPEDEPVTLHPVVDADECVVCYGGLHDVPEDVLTCGHRVCLGCAIRCTVCPVCRRRFRYGRSADSEWDRDLTAEGVEPNPGPVLLSFSPNDLCGIPKDCRTHDDGSVSDAESFFSAVAHHFRPKRRTSGKTKHWSANTTSCRINVVNKLLHDSNFSRERHNFRVWVDGGDYEVDDKIVPSILVRGETGVREYGRLMKETTCQVDPVFIGVFCKLYRLTLIVYSDADGPVTFNQGQVEVEVFLRKDSIGFRNRYFALVRSDEASSSGSADTDEIVPFRPAVPAEPVATIPVSTSGSVVSFVPLSKGTKATPAPTIARMDSGVAAAPKPAVDQVDEKLLQLGREFHARAMKRMADFSDQVNECVHMRGRELGRYLMPESDSSWSGGSIREFLTRKKNSLFGQFDRNWCVYRLHSVCQITLDRQQDYLQRIAAINACGHDPICYKCWGEYCRDKGGYKFAECSLFGEDKRPDRMKTSDVLHEPVYVNVTRTLEAGAIQWDFDGGPLSGQKLENLRIMHADGKSKWRLWLNYCLRSRIFYREDLPYGSEYDTIVCEAISCFNVSSKFSGRLFSSESELAVLPETVATCLSTYYFSNVSASRLVVDGVSRNNTELCLIMIGSDVDPRRVSPFVGSKDFHRGLVRLGPSSFY